MQNLKKAFLLPVLFFSISAFSQKDPVILSYISKYKDIAIAEMQRTGVPASIKLAQGIHETSAGESILVKKSNNHFGIKCKSDWKGESVKHTDDAPNECFRKYDSPFESYMDHSDFLKNSARYASLFQLEPTDYAGWAKGLKKAGYATNPKYPQVIIKLIEDYNLQDYTMVALGKMESTDLVQNGELSDADEKFIQKATDKKAAVIPALNKETKKYPEGEFKINDTKVVWITKGTSFISIAKHYDVPLARLFEFNDMKQHDEAQKDQLVFLQRKRKSGSADRYVVKEGETLHDVAQQCGIRMENLIEYNRINTSADPKPGTILYLRSMSPADIGRN